MEPEVQASENVTQESADVSVRDEMKAFLEGGSEKAESEAVSETEPELDESEESEDSESQEDSEESEESDETVEEEPKQERKRLNRNQRLKAKIAAMVQENEKVLSERDKAVEYAYRFKQKFESAQEQLNQILEAAKGHGLEVNPLHLDNFNLKMQQREKEIIEQVAKANEDERVKLQLQRAQAEQADDFANKALSLASKFAGGDKSQIRPLAHEILKAHAIALRTDPDATLAKTAKIVMAMKSPPAEKKQAESNRSAVQPRTANSRSGGVPVFKNTRDAMMAHLGSILKGE